MADERNVPDENSDLFVSHIDFRALNAHKSLRSGFSVLRRCIFSKEAAAKCEALIRRFRPDVLHCQNIHAHLTPSVVLVARRFGIPVVWTMHDYKVMCPNSHFRLDTTGALCEACRPGRYWPAARTRCKKGSLLASTLAAVEAYGHWLRRVREKVDCFIAPSGFLADRLLAHGWPPERVRHVPNFIDPPAREPAAGDGRHFLFVGKLEPLKGIDTLLEAARQVPGAKVLLAGGCEDAGVRARLAQLPPNVEYLGVQAADNVRRLMAEARAVVVPSVWYENQPMVILEAFSVGVPVIGSRLGGIPELVPDGERGLLIEPGNAGGLAAGIRALQDSPERARTMGAAAREYVAEHHSRARHLSLISEIYERAVAPARHAAVVAA